MRWWHAIVGACLLLAVTSVRASEEEQTEEVGEKKEEFVPPKFVAPRLSSESATGALLWDFFGGRGAIGKTWIKSGAKKDGVDADIAKYNGEWEIAAPSEVSIEGDYSLVVKTAARHHAISAKLSRPFTFAEEAKPLVIQYEVRFEEGQECGGGYLKLLSEGAEKDLAQFNDKTAYTIMFGPDKCSPNGKIHLIFRFKNPKNNTISEHHAKQPSSIDSSYWDDHRSHLYTLTVHPDGKYTVAVDRKTIYSGSMLSDVSPAIEPPKEIHDPEDKKPEEWDDRAEIEDETATKPEDWDENAPKEIVDEAAEMPSDWKEDEQPLIADPEAKKPDDWDEDMDGEWEPPMIENPECKGASGCGEWKRPTKTNPAYKGKWRRPKIANPAFKGIWSPRLIENPDYFEPSKPFSGLAPISAVGIELWTMSKQILFDNLLVADSESVAAEAARLTYDVRMEAESKLRASKGESEGIVKQFWEQTEKYPWLWAVIVLVVLIPLVLISVYCFGRKSGPAGPDAAGYRKKYDVAEEDDEEVPPLVDEAGEEVAEEPVEEEIQQPKKRETPARKASKSPSRGASAKKSARQQIEEDSDGSEAAGDGSQEEPEEEEVKEEKKPESAKPTPKPKRGRPKKAD